jgi:glycosyltransferase involved in cell wall biosynthesis
LTSGSSLAGLTSLTDALGCGKPVIMTRHPLIDIDLEKEGIGRWVNPGDVTGWIDALCWFRDNPGEAAAMGNRALQLARERFNSKRFAEQIAGILSETLTGNPRA